MVRDNEKVLTLANNKVDGEVPMRIGVQRELEDEAHKQSSLLQYMQYDSYHNNFDNGNNPIFKT